MLSSIRVIDRDTLLQNEFLLQNRFLCKSGNVALCRNICFDMQTALMNRNISLEVKVDYVVL